MIMNYLRLQIIRIMILMMRLCYLIHIGMTLNYNSFLFVCLFFLSKIDNVLVYLMSHLGFCWQTNCDNISISILVQRKRMNIWIIVYWNNCTDQSRRWGPWSPETSDNIKNDYCLAATIPEDEIVRTVGLIP